MKLTNRRIVDLLNTIGSVINKDFPIKITFQLMENQDKLIKPYETYFKAKEKVKSEEELLELLELETEVDITPIDKEELIQSGINLSPAQLIGLKRIING